MLFGEWLDTILALLQNNLLVTVGGCVAVLILSLLFLRLRRRSRRLEAATLAAIGGSSTDDKALNWAPPEQSYADRRGSVRRVGAPVRVSLSSPNFRNRVNDGYVVDRSTGGLRIILQGALAPGSTLQVRAVNAPDTIGFVTVIVRSCRKTGDHFELGCEFENSPPWNVLLLFG